MVEIRKYEHKDYEGVRHVCLYSDGPNNSSKKSNDFILLTYCNYYIEHEPENCFVAEDGGRVVGYIICTADYDIFEKAFRKKYLPRVFKLGIDKYFGARFSATMQKKHKKTHPAHLHIDILPEYQRMGIGGKLVDALCSHLKSAGVKGVMLTAGASNVKGVNFYSKYGFELLEKRNGCVAYGLRL